MANKKGFFYTPMTKCALQFCYNAHQNQIDKSGMPYIFHPFHLAEQMTTESEICVALLHDVVEDTEYTMDDLIQAGFSEDVIEAVRLLTHDENVPYMDYVKALKGNPIARKVKLADLAHNSDLARQDVVTERDLERVEKYRKAKEILLTKDGNA